MLKNLLFVCTINRHRSIIGEYLFKSLLKKRDRGLAKNIRVSSAGIVTPEQKLELKKNGIGLPRPLFGYRPMPCVILHMQKAGIDVSTHRSRALTAKTAKDADLIIAMGESHKNGILDMYPSTKGNVVTLAELSRPFVFMDIVVEEPPGLMPPPKFCMLMCDHWSVTGTVKHQIEDRLEEAVAKIINQLGAQ